MDVVALAFSVVIFVIGLIFLIKGSDWFVDGAAFVANRVGVSEALIALTLVAFATSLPEMATCVVASAQQRDEISLGNIIGSNIANICLVLAVSALLVRLDPGKESTRDASLMMGITLLLMVMIAFDRRLDWYDGAIFLAIFAGYIYYLYTTIDVEGRKKRRGPYSKELVMTLIGIGGVFVGAFLFVEGAVGMAEIFKVPQLIIGLTLVAVGTSLPELATSVNAVYKKKFDISVGNVLGSNIINILLILGLVAIIHPIDLDSFSDGGDSILYINMPILIFASFVAMLYTNRKIGKVSGLMLLSVYVVFIFIISQEMF